METDRTDPCAPYGLGHRSPTFETDMVDHWFHREGYYAPGAAEWVDPWPPQPLPNNYPT